MSIDEKSVTIVLETIYNLNTGEVENAKPGVENIFGDIWKNKAFEDVDHAFAELNEYINSKFDKGAEPLTEEEGDEINKYFRNLFVIIHKGFYPKSFKIGSIAHVYTVRTIFIADKKEI